MDLKKYIYGHCVHPVRAKVWDAYSQQYVEREVPCGKCLHCVNTRVNEWCTRLFAQAKYSKYTYYISLDYAPFKVTDETSMKLARETAACFNNLNSTHSYGLHPILLQKNHLQDFYKRLRKNLGFPLQYFACGEYGTHAEGHGYGRPHFHNIIFSNNPITPQDFERAWSINGYKIGRVDYVDMRQVGLSEADQNKIFKYVCKYLQKSNFNFEELATINFHRAYFKSLQKTLIETDTLFPKQVDIQDQSKIEYNWRKYIKDYSPFVVCSRRPSVGYQYFAENVERFESGDFRCFGLPKDAKSFPLYYVRKTKESLCRFRSIGLVSKKPSSASRLENVVQILIQVQNDRLNISNWSEIPEYTWRVGYSKKLGENTLALFYDSGRLAFQKPLTYFHLYDDVSKLFYQFDGYGYNVWRKIRRVGYSKLGRVTIDDVINDVVPEWQVLFESFYKPQRLQRELRESELHDTISALYKGDTYSEKYSNFMKEVSSRYQAEIAANFKTDLLRINSKTEF